MDFFDSFLLFWLWFFMFRRLGLFVVFILMFSFLAVPSSVSGSGNGDLTDYYIYVEFFPEDNVLNGTEMVEYKNLEGEDLDSIYFHLYPNSFVDEENLSSFNSFSDEFDPGWIDIKSVRFNGDFLGEDDFSVNGTLLRIDRGLDSGDTVNLEFGFSVKIPNLVGRFGHHNGVYYLGNWYPILSVYDDGWDQDPYYEVGDPFYSDVSNYLVEFKVPSDYSVAHTGSRVSEKYVDGKSRLTIKASKVRDFALAFSDEYVSMEEEISVNGRSVKFKCFATDKTNLEESFKWGKRTLRFYSNVFGVYPYDQFTIAETMISGGMEYPQLVFVGPRFIWTNPYVTIHETAHQWWYGVVGNDEVEDPWLDESLAEYSTSLFYRNSSEFDFRGDMGGTLSELDVNDLEGVGVSIRNITWENYVDAVYKKGKLMHFAHGELIGHDNYTKILNSLYEEYKYENINSTQYIKFVNNKTSINSKEFYNSWLKKGYLDHSIENASIKKIDQEYQLNLTILNKGGIIYPKELILKGKDKSIRKNIGLKTGKLQIKSNYNVKSLKLNLKGLNSSDMNPLNDKLELEEYEYEKSNKNKSNVENNSEDTSLSQEEYRNDNQNDLIIKGLITSILILIGIYILKRRYYERK